jgi:hypothetical protein
MILTFMNHSFPSPFPLGSKTFFFFFSLLRFVVNCHSSHLTMGKRDAREKNANLIFKGDEEIARL